MRPLLSIITTVKNGEKWLADCIQSGIAQDFQDWEWIWVDDHSDDDTHDILCSFAESEPRLRILQNVGDGIIPALNMAFEKAEGVYLSRMDADDLMPPGRWTAMIELLNESGPQHIVTGKVNYFSETEISEGYLKYQDWINGLCEQNDHWQHVYRECVIASPNWIIHKSDLEAIGGFSDLVYPEDYDLVFQWYKRGYEIKSLDTVSLLWREHPERTSRNSQHYAQRSFFDLKIKRFLELDYHSDRPLVLWGTAKKGRLTASLLKENGVPFHWMGEKRESIQGLEVRDYKNITSLESPLVLLSIYPTAAIRQEIEDYLQQLGVRYWYL